MNTSALIPVVSQVIGGQSVQTVDARTLHAFLEVGKVFAAWIQERIEQYSFEQGKDFEVFSDSGNNPQGGRPTKDYALTLDMAKELAMVERTPKGKQARQYFIECEKRLRSGGYTAPAPTGSKFERELQALARDTMRTLKAFGITGNAAVLACDQYCEKIMGQRLLPALGMTHLHADPRGMTYTPTELGKMRNPPVSPVVYNQMLAAAGLQVKDPVHEGKWLPTEAADGLYEWLDTAKRYSDGTPVKQLKWFAEVDDRVRLLLN